MLRGESPAVQIIRQVESLSVNEEEMLEENEE